MRRQEELQIELLEMFLSKGKVRISGTKPNKFNYPFSYPYSEQELMDGIDVLFEKAYMVQVEEDSPWWKLTDLAKEFMENRNDNRLAMAV